MTVYMSSSVRDVLAAMMAAGTRRLALVWVEGQLRAFPEVFQPLADVLTMTDAQDGHEGVFLQAAPAHNALFGAFVHRTARGPGVGGVRQRGYRHLGAFIQEGLRLARSNSRRSALAGLWWGGAMGGIARAPHATLLGTAARDAFFRDYGRFVSSLRGLYVVAEDIAAKPDDMAAIAEGTRHIVRIPATAGGIVPPVAATATGTFTALTTTFDAIGQAGLAGKSVVVLGAGRVSTLMVRPLLAAGVARLLVTDLTARRLEALKETVGDDPRLTTRMVRSDDTSIFSEPCDGLIPNGMPAVLNATTIPRLACRVVCGAAPNQLVDEGSDGADLAARGIAFVPDFIANRMGIVRCAEEAPGVLPKGQTVLQHLDPSWEGSIDSTLRRVMARARAEGTTPVQVAADMADAASAVPHSWRSDEGRALRDALVAKRWHER